MRRYETIFIVDPDLSEEDRVSLLDRFKEIIPQQEGVLIEEDLWGVRKLAYDIKKKPRGFYARLDYCGTAKVVDELERFSRIDDRVMKYLTVQLDADADVEKIQADIAAAKAAVAEQQAPAAETTAEATTDAATTDTATTPAEQPAETAAATESAAPTPETEVKETTPES